MTTSVTAITLGIDFSGQGEAALFKWLIASFLIGKRIRAATAIKAYQVIVEQHRIDTPAKLSRCAHRELVRMLGQGGYARYDESTARRLHALAGKLEREYEGRIGRMREISADRKAFEQRLLAFEGIGPKTLEIFMREAGAALT